MFGSTEDTITALATPIGEGAVSVIRISGNKSFNAINEIFKGKEKITKRSANRIFYGKISGSDEVIDDVLVSVFCEPNSYTGEDSVEISTHGSQLITNKIISELLKLNIRLAEPGEFTKRAFLNGKLDLAQAEAVLDIINSRSEAALRGARNQLDGILSKKVDELREMLINSSSLIELELDFAEEDLEFLPVSEMENRLNTILEELEKLINTYSFGRVVRDGVNVAIVGRPNVGKSSLLNYILKESRAIVSEIPGTTRDIIREEVSIDGILYRLFDTAGIRFTEDAIEKEGVLRSRNAVKKADLVIFMNDVLTGFDKELYLELIKITSPDRIINVTNKVDISEKHVGENDILISALTGAGLGELFSRMKEVAVGSNSFTEKTAVVSNIRHHNGLQKARENILKAKKSIKQRLSGEFIAVDLRNAENSLGEIIGKVTNDDILNNIFSKFCIGK